MLIVVTILLLLVLAYLVTGLLFAILFLAKGIEKVDPATHGSGMGFRLIILPGTVALWPVLLRKWIQSKPMRHDETAA